MLSKLSEKYEEALGRPLPNVSVDDETIEFILNNPQMYRGSVRVHTGHIYLDDDFKKFKEETFAKELPHRSGFSCLAKKLSKNRRKRDAKQALKSSLKCVLVYCLKEKSKLKSLSS